MRNKYREKLQELVDLWFTCGEWDNTKERMIDLDRLLYESKEILDAYYPHEYEHLSEDTYARLKKEGRIQE